MSTKIVFKKKVLHLVISLISYFRSLTVMFNGDIKYNVM